MDYAELKKLDEESLEKLQEATGPVDECICRLLSPSPEEKSFVTSVKKAFASFGVKKKKVIMDNFNRGPAHKGNPGILSTKEVVKRNASCGKCGCDNEKFVLKHSDFSIRITSPDISTICPCPSDCLPDKDKLQNDIKVIVEHAEVAPGPFSENPENYEPNKED